MRKNSGVEKTGDLGSTETFLKNVFFVTLLNLASEAQIFSPIYLWFIHFSTCQTSPNHHHLSLEHCYFFLMRKDPGFVEPDLYNWEIFKKIIYKIMKWKYLFTMEHESIKYKF